MRFTHSLPRILNASYLFFLLGVINLLSSPAKAAIGIRSFAAVAAMT